MRIENCSRFEPVFWPLDAEANNLYALAPGDQLKIEPRHLTDLQRAFIDCMVAAGRIAYVTDPATLH